MSARPLAIRWTPTAQRDLRRLPEKVATAVVEFVFGSLADNPERVGRELRLALAGRHAACRGDYRLIYPIDRSSGVLVILHVDHRADMYR